MDNDTSTEDVFAGDASSFEQEVRQKFKDIENIIAGLNPRNFAGIQSKELRAATRANVFGDGSDGNYTLDANQAAVSGLFSKASTTFTLLRDGFFKNLTVANGYTLKTNGFRVFTTADLINNGVIDNSGNDGVDGTDGADDASAGTGAGTGGVGGSATNSGSLPAGLEGKRGGDGGNAGNTNDNGSAGTSGGDANKSLGASGSGGGGGGAGGSANTTAGGNGGNGGSGGSQTGTVFNVPRSPSAAYLLEDSESINNLTSVSTLVSNDTIQITPFTAQFDGFIFATTATNGMSITCGSRTMGINAGDSSMAIFKQGESVSTSGTGTKTVWRAYFNNSRHSGSAGAGSGGGGGGGENAGGGSVNPGAGGGGGGSGSAGGFISIFAFRLINNGVISATGGDGGAGGDGGDADQVFDGNRSGGGGGGGGGAGGGGGIIILVYGVTSGSGTIDVTGGTGGAAGTGGLATPTSDATDGTDGTAGSNGADGTLIEIEIG